MNKFRLLFLLSVVFLSINFTSFAETQKVPAIKQTIHDEAIEVPASLTANIDSLLSDWIITNHLSADLDCIHNSVNPDLPDSVYIERLSKLPSIIEMPYNQIVRTYINMYAGRLRERVSYMLGLSHFYFPLFEQALDAENMPLELKYLPVIESALNPAATSRVGAAGLWQFMIYTGRDYGLEVNDLVDERRDPVKSTYVAVRYLKALHRIYGDWGLAIAAYNCGPGNVNKAIRRAGGKRDYWAIYFNLPKETRGYLPAFIAVNYLMNYSKEHNICAAKCVLPLNSDTVQVNQMMHFQQIADILNVPVEEIRIMNPQFRRDLIPGNIKPYTLRLPMNSAYAFIDVQDTIANYHADQFLLNFRKTVDPGTPEDNLTQTITRHRVGRNESVASVAQRYGVSVSDLKSWNHLRSTKLRSGTLLVVYRDKPAAPAVESGKETLTAQKKTKEEAKPASQEEKTPAITYHKVSKGETISSIARKYGVTVSDLKNWNDLATSNVKQGSLLAVHTDEKADRKEADRDKDVAVAVPAKTKSSEKKMKTETVEVVLQHKVKKGETISEIAHQYHVLVSDVKKWNKLRSAKLDRGDKLAIHTTKTRTVAVATEEPLLAHKGKSNDTARVSVDSVNVKSGNSHKLDNKSTLAKSNNIQVRGFEYYRVRKGDTLWAIASKYPGISVEQILQANEMRSHDAIQVGMRIKIPKS